MHSKQRVQNRVDRRRAQFGRKKPGQSIGRAFVLVVLLAEHAVEHGEDHVLLGFGQATQAL